MLWLLMLLAFPAALAVHGVTAVASTHGEHRGEHHSAHGHEDNNHRDHREHAPATRERDHESAERHARADERSDIEERSAAVTAARVQTEPGTAVRRTAARPLRAVTAVAAPPPRTPPRAPASPAGPAGGPAPPVHSLPPLFAPPPPVADGAFPVTPAPALNLAVGAIAVIAAGLVAVVVLMARRRI